MNKLTIIHNALEILSKYGIEHLTLSSLATKCNITKSTIYNYFKSKDEILDEVFGSAHDAFMKEVFTINLSLNKEEIIKEYFDHWALILSKDDNILFLRSVFSLSYTLSLAREEYNTIVLMLSSHVSIITSSLHIKREYEELFITLFLSFLLRSIEDVILCNNDFPSGEEILKIIENIKE